MKFTKEDLNEALRSDNVKICAQNLISLYTMGGKKLIVMYGQDPAKCLEEMKELRIQIAKEVYTLSMLAPEILELEKAKLLVGYYKIEKYGACLSVIPKTGDNIVLFFKFAKLLDPYNVDYYQAAMQKLAAAPTKEFILSHLQIIANQINQTSQDFDLAIRLLQRVKGEEKATRLAELAKKSPNKLYRDWMVGTLL